MNEQNLRPGEYKLTQEEAKRGGIASGKSRRRKADLRRAAKELLEGVFLDKNGNERTGEELVMAAIMANAADPESRNWGKAVDAFIELTGARITPEQKKKLKAETDLIKAKTALLRGGDDGALGKLDAILQEISDEAFGEAE